MCGLLGLFGIASHAQNRIEYFWNTDPGVGHATMLSEQGTGLVNCQIPTKQLKDGAHLLGIRVLNGKYASPTLLKLVCKSSSFADGGMAEYFWDKDPGIGQAGALQISTAADGCTVSFSLPTEGLPSGIHFLGLRLSSGAGWSPTYSHIIAVAPLGGRVDCVEYFWDEDPGLGQATRYDVPADSDCGEVTVSMDVLTEGLSHGIHMLGIRSHSGIWSQTILRVVAIGAGNNTIEAVEYFWDEDPGQGQATQLSFDGTNVAVVSTEIESPSDFGSHTLVIRARASGIWGTPYVQTFCINAEPDFSLPKDTVCKGEKFTISNLTRNATDQTTYSWDMDSDGNADATDSDDFVYAYTKAGEFMITLSVKTVGDCVSTCTMPIVVLDTANPTVSLSASKRTSCAGDTICFVAKSQNAGGYPEYEWTVNGEVVQDATGDTLLLNDLSDRDKVQVTVFSSNPCSQKTVATSPAITITVNPVPDVSLAPMFPVYTTEEHFILSGGSPDGGAYYINGKEASMFSPQKNMPGIYVLSYRYTTSQGCVSEATQTFELCEPGTASLMLGDVNKDEQVDNKDILCTVDYIYGSYFPMWNMKTADINSDGGINVTDIVGIVGIMHKGANESQASESGGDTGLSLIAPLANAGNAHEVALDFILNGSDRPSGVQFDVAMPKGIELVSNSENVVVGRKAGSSTNTFTILAYTTDMKPLGRILHVKAILPVNIADGTYPIVPQNVIIVAGDMRYINHRVTYGQLTVGQTTDINGTSNGEMGIIVERNGLRVLNAEGGSLVIYDMAGRFVAASTISTNDELIPVSMLVQNTYVAEINKDGKVIHAKFFWRK